MKYVKRKGEKFGRSMAWAGSKPNHTYTNRHARIHTRRLSFQAQHTNKQNTKFRLLQFFQNQQNKTKKEPSTIRRCVVFVSFSKGPNERKNINLWNLMRRIYTDNQISKQNEKKKKKIAHTSVALVTAHGAHIRAPRFVTRSTNAFSLSLRLVAFSLCRLLLVASSHIAGCVFYFPFCASRRVNASHSFGCHHFSLFDNQQIYKLS